MDELKARYRAGRVGDVEVKRRLAAVLNRFLDPVRERRAELLASHPTIVEDVLDQGTARARAEAKLTLTALRDAMGRDYFRG